MTDKKDKYVYPAVFEKGEVKGYCVTFPDLPGCITEGDNLDEAVSMAREAVAVHLYGMEEDGDRIPAPTAPEEIQAPPGAFVTPVEAWMPLIRDQIENKAIKKTLTIPKWLDDLAVERRVNFSHVLQEALKRQLGVSGQRRGE